LVFVVPESMDMAEASTFGVAWVTACQVSSPFSSFEREVKLMYRYLYQTKMSLGPLQNKTNHT
jgi:hypothetical protein